MKILMVSDLHMDKEASKAIEAASKKVPFTFVGGDIGLRRDEDPEHVVDYIVDTFQSKRTIITPGNHDFWPVNLLRLYDAYDGRISVVTDRPIRTEHEGDDFTSWFSPWSKQFCNWNWMMDDDEDWHWISEYCNAVVTHGPAYGILDETPNGDHAGSQKLLNAIVDAESIYYVFSGHIHGNDYGHVKAYGIDWYNISVLNENYRFKGSLPVFDTFGGKIEYWTEKDWS